MNFLKMILKWLTVSTSQDKSQLTLEELVTTDNLRSLMESKGYVFFNSNKPYNVNIVGVRRDNAGTNTFDDFMAVMYLDEDLEPVCKVYPITADPGAYWLKNPMNPKGTAILVPGQYRGAYTIGAHRNQYTALVQNKPVKVWRDNNKDEVIDYSNIKLLSNGCFGINIHRSNPYDESFLVDKWSAGCQVFKAVDDFDEFMDICQKAQDICGPSFSYTLLTEQELRKHLE